MGKASRGARSRVGIYVGGVAVTAAFTIVVVYFDMNAALVASSPIVMAVLAALDLFSGRRPLRTPVSLDNELEWALERLTTEVGEVWKREAEILGLAEPAPMPVKWRNAAEHISDHPKNLELARVQFSEDSSQIAHLTDEFKELPRKRLVVLGGPGCGKSTLAVQVLSELLSSRTDKEPVPILLSATGWNVDADATLDEWLESRLQGGYPFLRSFSSNMAQRLISEGWIIPILDGLDEVHPFYRSKVLRALNKSMSGDDPLIVTCRTSEFTELVDEADVVTAALVIEAQELLADDVVTFLSRCIAPGKLPEWKDVLDEIRWSPVFREVTASPLGLWLLRTVYVENNAVPEHLLARNEFPDAASVKRELFRQLIPSVIKNRRPDPVGKHAWRPRRSWDPQRCSKWLAYLAVQMGEGKDIRWWSLPVAHRRVGLILGGVLGSTVAASSAGVGVALWDKWVAIAMALTLGGIAYRSAYKAISGCHLPHCANLTLRHRIRPLAKRLLWWTGLPLLIAGFAYKLCELALQSSDLAGESAFLFLNLATSLPLAILSIIGVSRWVTEPHDGAHSRRPTSSYVESRTIALLTPIGIVFVVAPLMFIGRGEIWKQWNEAALGGGRLVLFFLALTVMVISIVFVWVILNELAWGHYQLVSFWLWVTFSGPRKLIRFLEDANRLGLLRVSGAAYQFRHAELQENLVCQLPGSR